ncbi:toxin-antitoxin system HicB family antitoxin [Candidatus Dependentiae bacterium]|nr:toxin-antitoxin system HicB family antitoxin [Candidatus Dependentiae bacterium]
MGQYCISLPEQLHEKLKVGAKKQQISVSQYIRKLVEMGMELEDLTDQNKNGGGENSSIFSEEKQRTLWKNLLSWSLESRVLSRVLFEKILDGKYPDVKAEIKMIKEKSEAKANGLLDINED